MGVLPGTGEAAEEDLVMNISAEEERTISERIVQDYGDGILKGGYLFDQIKGVRGRRVRLSEAFFAALVLLPGLKSSDCVHQGNPDAC